MTSWSAASLRELHTKPKVSCYDRLILLKSEENVRQHSLLLLEPQRTHGEAVDVVVV
jgi:hypothetical protein